MTDESNDFGIDKFESIGVGSNEVKVNDSTEFGNNYEDSYELEEDSNELDELLHKN